MRWRSWSIGWLYTVALVALLGSVVWDGLVWRFYMQAFRHELTPCQDRLQLLGTALDHYQSERNGVWAVSLEAVQSNTLSPRDIQAYIYSPPDSNDPNAVLCWDREPHRVMPFGGTPRFLWHVLRSDGRVEYISPRSLVRSLLKTAARRPEGIAGFNLPDLPTQPWRVFWVGVVIAVGIVHPILRRRWWIMAWWLSLATVVISAPMSEIIRDAAMRLRCSRNLEHLDQAVQAYRHDANYAWPQSLKQIVPYFQTFKVYTRDDIPTCIGDGMNEWPYQYHQPYGGDKIQPICWDTLPHVGSSSPTWNVLYSDGHVEKQDDMAFLKTLSSIDTPSSGSTLTNTKSRPSSQLLVAGLVVGTIFTAITLLASSNRKQPGS